MGKQKLDVLEFWRVLVKGRGGSLILGRKRNVLVGPSNKNAMWERKERGNLEARAERKERGNWDIKRGVEKGAHWKKGDDERNQQL